ncbi:MAG: DUF3575 domain-containing protein [Cytophagaceae bacterium]
MRNFLKPAISLLTCIFLLSGSINSHAQQSEGSVPDDQPGFFSLKKLDRRNIISLHPFAFFGNSFVMSFEHKFKGISNFSLRLSGGVTLSDSPGYRYLPANAYDGTGLFGYQAELQPRFYIGEPEYALNGFYFAPYAGYRSISVSYNQYFYDYADPYYSYSTIEHQSSYSIYSGGVLFGYQLITSARLTFDLAFGGGIAYTEGADGHGHFNILSPIGTGVRPRALLNIGYLF